MTTHLFNCFYTILRLFSISCMTLGIVGCVSFDASHWLSESNGNFIYRNELFLNFEDNSVVTADYLGKINNKYVYMMNDLKGREVFFKLPTNSNEKALVTTSLDMFQATSNKKAIFHFFSDKEKMESELMPQDNNQTIKPNINNESEYPSNLYVNIIKLEKCERWSNTLCRKNFTNTSVGFSTIQYSFKGEKFSNYTDQQPELSFFSFTILGARSLGYLFTVPVDFALGFTPYPLLTGCPWLIGCQ